MDKAMPELNLLDLNRIDEESDVLQSNAKVLGFDEMLKDEGETLRTQDSRPVT